MNALSSPFVNCLMTSGGFDQLSVLDAIKRSKEIASLADTPRDNFCSLRFIEALLGWSAKQFDIDASLNFLSKKFPTFELFGPARFFQFSTPEGVGHKKPPSVLIEEIPSGNTINFLRGVEKAYDSKMALCPSCCLRGMLRIPAFCTAGGRMNNEEVALELQKSPSINGSPPLYVYPIGNTLYDTLKLNFQEPISDDHPTWENKPRNPVGYIEAFTWMPRGVYLHQSAELAECYRCGDKSLSVTECCFTAVSDKKKPIWSDPHIITLTSSKKKKYSMPLPSPVQDKYAGYAGYVEKVETEVRKAVAEGTNRLLSEANKQAECVGFECVGLATGTGLKFFYEHQQTIANVKVEEPVVPIEPLVQKDQVNAELFVRRLLKLSHSDLALLKDSKRGFDNLDKYKIFADLWRKSGLSGKRIPLLVAVAFAHHPANGYSRLKVDDLNSPIALPKFQNDLLKKIATHTKPISWARLVEDLYNLHGSVKKGA